MAIKGYTSQNSGMCLLTFISQVSFQWRKCQPLKEVQASEALRAWASFDYFICNIPVVICKLDLVFRF